MSEGIVTKVLDGDDLALAQILTKIENREPGYREIMEELFENTTGSKVIGFTGPPGAGKSTLLNEVVTEYRQQEKTVGVIAVDPSSPYTGGSFLGDRFRQD